MPLPSDASSPITPVVPMANAVKAQFANPPSLVTIVRTTLAEAIGQRYPSLVFDLHNTQVATPVSGGNYHFYPLMPWVMAYLGSGTAIDFSPAHNSPYYLSEHMPDRLEPADGTLDMKVIEGLIKELTWRVPIVLQGAVSDFWEQHSHICTSRWLWISDVFKDTLTVSALHHTGLSDRERSAINQVLICPEREDRILQYGENATRVYLLKATITNAGVSRSAVSSRIALVNANQTLVYNSNGKISAYRTSASHSQSIAKRFARLYQADEVRIKRYELDGNAFETHAAAILNRQLELLGSIKLPAHIGWETLESTYRDIVDPSDFFREAPNANPQTLDSLKQHLPDWLQNASIADQSIYRQYCLALSSAKKNSQGRTYLSEITDIRTYAADVLHQQMQRDQEQFEHDMLKHIVIEQFHPDDIELTFVTVTGPFGTIGIKEPVTMSLTDLALKNLSGRPKGELTLRHRRGLSLPFWLTPNYITDRNGLIEQVNIGEAYPSRLEDLLLSATQDAKLRERLFSEHVRLLLPLQALEFSLKHENGMTPVGARYVAAVMKTLAADREVEGQAIVMKHLALVRKHEATPDVVSNMYIIEPLDIHVGPHVLYRPFYAQSLIEFPTRAALLDAIAHPGDLQNSVLTWLSDSARPIYDNGGFKEPHYVRFGLGDEFSPLEIPAPAELATDGVSSELLQYLQNGQLMLFLYGSNARALVDQAKAESVSNSESRWAVLLEGGGLIFNSLLLIPALPRPLMLAGWLFSLASSVSQDIPALASNDSATRELAVADVLLNLGMLLFHLFPSVTPEPTPLTAVNRAQALHPFMPASIVDEWPAPPPPKVVEGIVALAGEFPNTESTTLDFSFSSARNRLTHSQRERLDLLKVPYTLPLPAPATGGLYKGLYEIDKKWHVLIGQDLFAVHISASNTGVIIAPSGIDHHGPNVRADSNGNWSLDLRLRLQGGAPNETIAGIQQKNAARRLALEAELEAFHLQEFTLHRAVNISHQILERAIADPRFSAEQLANMREQFATSLQKQLSALLQLLDSTEERIKLNIPFPKKIVISLLGKAFKNQTSSLALSSYEQRGLQAKWPQFTTPDRGVDVAGEADPEGFIRYLKEQIEVTDRTIAKLELRSTYGEQLYALGGEGTENANNLFSELPLNAHTSLTLKGVQLSCLKLTSSKVSAVTLVESSLDEAIDPLKEQVRTHNELNTLELSTSNRIEVLDNLVKQYGQALDALQGISIVNAEDLELDYFDKLQVLVKELYQDVVKQLAAEIAPPLTLQKRARKRNPSSLGRPQKRVINTRKKGPLIGEVKPAGSEWPIEVIELRSSYDNQLLSTYSQHGDEWVEIVTQRAEAPAAKRMLNIIKGDARKLFDMLDGHIQKARQYKRQSQHPVEVEELLNHEAEKLKKLATELHGALLAQPQDTRLPADQLLVDNMVRGATQMIDEGKALRIQLSLELPPTDGNLRYLLDQERVQIAGLGRRIRLQGERQDYIQEYAINDRQGAALWYAHFHYAQADTPKADYSLAHLKTKEQRTLSYFTQLATAKSGQAIVNIHRGQIGKKLAEREFLPLAT